jgi:hypothetical protein
MKGICSDGPAQGWICDNLPKPAPRTLLVPRDIEKYLPGHEPQSIQAGTEFPMMPGSYPYRFARMEPVEHATVPGAIEAAAVYVHDPSLDSNDGYMPSGEDWLQRED